VNKHKQIHCMTHSADCRCASEGMSLMIVGW